MAAIVGLRLTGGAANSDPNASLGGARSGHNVSATPLANLFAHVTPAQGIAGAVHYRAVDLVNGGDAPAAYLSVWIDPNTPSPSTALALGAGALESTLAIGAETTAPAGISFGEPTEGARLALPDLPVGQGVRVWLRRTVLAGAENAVADGATLIWEYA